MKMKNNEKSGVGECRMEGKMREKCENVKWELKCRVRDWMDEGWRRD